MTEIVDTANKLLDVQYNSLNQSIKYTIESSHVASTINTELSVQGNQIKSIHADAMNVIQDLNRAEDTLSSMTCCGCWFKRKSKVHAPRQSQIQHRLIVHEPSTDILIAPAKFDVDIDYKTDIDPHLAIINQNVNTMKQEAINMSQEITSQNKNINTINTIVNIGDKQLKHTTKAVASLL